MGLLRYVGSIFLTLLPPRYRADMKLRSQAILCAAFQMFASILFVVTRLYLFALQGSSLPSLPDDVARELFIKHGGLFVQANTVVGLAGFWLNPINVLCYYFFFEGFVRLMSAMVGDQFIGTLPLYAISGVHGLLDKAAYSRHVGALVVDEVIRGGGKQGHDLKVYSCRPKLNWNPYMTVEFEGEFYQYVKEEQGPPPRRFMYYLKKNPVGRVVVVIDHYRIDKVLEPEPKKWAGTPGVWDMMFPHWNRPPLVADEVVRGSPRANYDLKIYCCRPKQDWNTVITIEFEEQWYQLWQEEKGTKSHPFVYYLRNSPPTRPAVVIRHYKPDDVLKEGI